MQKQPKYRLDYEAIPLPEDFPIRYIGHRQADTPITALHLHDHLEIGYCHSGSGIFVIENKVFSYRAGDVTVVNEHEVHLAQSTAGSLSDWSFVLLDPLGLLGTTADDPGLLETASLCGPEFPNLLSGPEHTDMAQTVCLLIEELRQGKPGWRSAVRGQVWSLMAQLHRLPGRTPAALEKVDRRPMERLAPALNCMTSRYAESVPVKELARQCGMSLTNFRRVFRSVTGRSPVDYLIHLRVQMAASLLRNTTRPITEIAMDVGCPTLSTFNRHFRRLQAMSPRDWRRGGCA
jgi:AraC-like DNA-binding protein